MYQNTSSHPSPLKSPVNGLYAPPTLIGTEVCVDAPVFGNVTLRHSTSVPAPGPYQSTRFSMPQPMGSGTRLPVTAMGHFTPIGVAVLPDDAVVKTGPSAALAVAHTNGSVAASDAPTIKALRHLLVDMPTPSARRVR